MGVLALALGGCVLISSTSTSQPASMGPIKLSFSACSDGSPSCTGKSNSGSIYELITDEVVPMQLLVAVRLPAGSTPPDALEATIGGGGSLAFSRSDSYEAELQALEPASPGERWWGWISSQTTYSQKTGQAFSLSILASLPRPADGGPLESPMHWRPVVGSRLVEVGLPAGRAVKCGTANDDLYDGFSEIGQVGSTVVCIDSPSPESARGFLTASFTDFGIEGSAVQAAPGSTVTAAFIARRTGPVDPATTFTLTAASTVPGGSVSIDRSTVTLGGDATEPVLATIGVPAGTRPGSYPVTLSATAAGKPDRSGTVVVTVPGTGAGIAIRGASLSHRRFRTSGGKKARKGKTPIGTKLRINLSAKGTLSLAVTKLGGKRPKSLGTSRRSLPAGKSTLRFRARIGKVKLKPGRYRLTLVAKDGSGDASAARRITFTVVG